MVRGSLPYSESLHVMLLLASCYILCSAESSESSTGSSESAMVRGVDFTATIGAGCNTDTMMSVIAGVSSDDSSCCSSISLADFGSYMHYKANLCSNSKPYVIMWYQVDMKGDDCVSEDEYNLTMCNVARDASDMSGVTVRWSALDVLDSKMDLASRAAPRVTATFVQSGSNPLLVASADSPHVLVLVVKMPYTKAKFDGAQQGLFKDAIASPAGKSPLNFDILSIAEARRRAGSIEVETNISAMDAASLHALSSSLGMGDSMLAKFNAEPTKRGLLGSTVVSVESKKSDLSDGAVAGMVIGSVACAAILFGAAVYLTKLNNKEYLAAKAKVMTEGAQKKSEEREDAAGEVDRKSNNKNHRVRVSEEVAGVQGVGTDTPAKAGMIST